jgi:hypothetical protein
MEFLLMLKSPALVLGITFSLAAALVGCGGNEKQQEKKSPEAAAQTSAGSLPKDLFAASAPPDAKPVADAIGALKDGDQVVLAGYVGGRAEPFVEGRAAFLLADEKKAPACSDGCSTPWDACCTDGSVIAANSLNVMVVDAQGAPLKVSLNGQSGLKPGASAVVAGTVRGSDKSLVLHASAIHVKPSADATKGTP